MTRCTRLGWLACLALAACYVGRTSRLGEIGPWPLSTAGAESGPAVTLRVYGTQRYDSGPADLEFEQLARCRDEALEAYDRSGLFRAVQAGWEGEDVIAEVNLSVNTKPVRQEAFLFGSVFSQVRDYSMRTRFRDRQGQSLGSVEVSEAIRSQSDPLFLVFGLHPSERALRQLIYDLHRATLRDAVKQKIFSVK